MTKLFKNMVRGAVRADKVTFRKDGTVEFRRAYFYRMGATAEKFGERVSRELTEAGFHVSDLQTEDRWAAWPKTSYFVATAKVAFRSVEGRPLDDVSAASAEASANS